MAQPGGFPAQTQIDREFQHDLAIARENGRSNRKTTLWSAGLAVGAALLSSILTIVGGQINGSSVQEEHIRDLKKTAYADLYESLRVSEYNTDIYADLLLNRTAFRAAPLAREEASQETIALYTMWQTSATDIHKASGDVRILASAEIVELAGRCSTALNARNSELLGIVNLLSTDVASGTSAL